MKKDAVVQALLELLHGGLLNARYYAYEGDSKQTLNEIDHIHNLPYIIKDGGAKDLGYYLEIQKMEYVQKTDGKAPIKFSQYWERLAALLRKTDTSQDKKGT